MSHPSENLSAYLSGELNEQERADIEEHLQGCQECATHLKEIHQLTRLLSQQPSPEPSRHFLNRVLRTIDQEVASSKTRKMRRRTIAILALAAAVVFFAILISIRFSAGPEQVQNAPIIQIPKKSTPSVQTPERSTQSVTQDTAQTPSVDDPEMIAQLELLEDMDLINNYENVEDLDLAVLMNTQETK